MVDLVILVGGLTVVAGTAAVALWLDHRRRRRPSAPSHRPWAGPVPANRPDTATTADDDRRRADNRDTTDDRRRAERPHLDVPAFLDTLPPTARTLLRELADSPDELARIRRFQEVIRPYASRRPAAPGVLRGTVAVAGDHGRIPPQRRAPDTDGVDLREVFAEDAALVSCLAVAVREQRAAEADPDNPVAAGFADRAQARLDRELAQRVRRREGSDLPVPLPSMREPSS